MSTHGATETLEIERKYAVSEAAALPAAAAFLAHALTLEAGGAIELRATYFDTPEAALGRQRVAVRLRHGGADEGWHMKIKGADGSRELAWPLGDAMPEGLRREIVDRIGESDTARLVAVATLETTRRIAHLCDADGTRVIELADDRVAATNCLSGESNVWREWEAELAPGASEQLLEVIEPLLTAVGATRVRGTSKLQRALGRDSDPAA